MQGERPEIPEWTAQLRASVRTVEALKERFPELPDPDGIARAAARFPFSIPPYYAGLVERASWDDPIFRMAVPSPEELDDPPFLLEDPIGENRHMVTPGLVHRYPDRDVLLLFYPCRIQSGTPRTVDCNAIAWAPPQALQTYDLADADRAFVERNARALMSMKNG